MQRKIIHIDMDAFYASVEQRDNPELRGRPVAVGGGEVRAVVCAASYEARSWGVRSAMPGAKARRLCPELIFVPPRFEVYKEVSRQIHNIFRDYTDLIEPLSLDEAFLDVTNNKRGMHLAQDIALEIKARIQSELGLRASAGVSYNKFLAKVASDYRKPDGFCVIHPDRSSDFIERLKIEDFWGVGRVTAERMHEEGIYTGLDLKRKSLTDLQRLFGKMGSVYYDFARGIDLRPVETEWQRKSVGCEYTLEADCRDEQTLASVISALAEDLAHRAAKSYFYGRTITLKVKYHDFSLYTRSYTPTSPATTAQEYKAIAMYLLQETRQADKDIRLLGLALSHPLIEQAGELWYQPALFCDEAEF